jgi:hypothetical protein
LYQPAAAIDRPAAERGTTFSGWLADVATRDLGVAFDTEHPMG